METEKNYVQKDSMADLVILLRYWKLNVVVLLPEPVDGTGINFCMKDTQ